MNTRIAAVLALVIPILALIFAASPAARAGEDPAQVRRLQEAGEILPLEAILERAQWRRYHRVLEADLERLDGRYYYELELLDKRGVVSKEFYDATTGERLHDGGW
ncbi:MAG TPA: peptidase [Gammaproteobacteria bacterium]|nr:peptidase [Gammaproteobacteria bacterium]